MTNESHRTAHSGEGRESVKPNAWMYHYPGAEFDARLQLYEGMSCEEEDQGMVETPLYAHPSGEVERLRAAMKQAEIHIDCASFRKAQDILLAALAQSEGAKSD